MKNNFKKQRVQYKNKSPKYTVIQLSCGWEWKSLGGEKSIGADLKIFPWENSMSMRKFRSRFLCRVHLASIPHQNLWTHTNCKMRAHFTYVPKPSAQMTPYCFWCARYSTNYFKSVWNRTNWWIGETFYWCNQQSIIIWDLEAQILFTYT